MIQILVAAALLNGLPPDIFVAMCEVESGLNAKVIHKNDGRGSSLGVCQVKFGTARMVGYHGRSVELLQPRVNAQVASLYLSHQLTRYKGNLTAALIAYNAGHLIKDTSYAAKVYRHATKYAYLRTK